MRKGSACEVMTLNILVKAMGNNLKHEFWENSLWLQGDESVQEASSRGGGEVTGKPYRK